MYPDCVYSSWSTIPDTTPCVDSGSTYIASTSGAVDDFLSYDDQLEIAAWEIIWFLFILAFVVLNVTLYPKKKWKK